MASLADLEALIGQLPQEGCNATPTPSLQCCCGNLDCQYLKHSTQALENLEADVQTAAQLGQVRRRVQ